MALTIIDKDDEHHLIPRYAEQGHSLNTAYCFIQLGPREFNKDERRRGRPPLLLAY